MVGQAAPAPRRALMLVNPNARRGELALSQAPRLEANGLTVTVERFGSPEELAADIAGKVGGQDLVIVAGGDGTLAAAAPAILKAGLPMGILPLGTANDLARTLGVPIDLDQAADIVLAGRTRRIDVGEVNGCFFFNVASLGLSAEVAERLTPQDKRKWGVLGYAYRAAEVLLTARPFTAVISSRGGERRVRSLQIAVGNGRHYGGGSVVHQDARIDDGHLDLYSLDPRAVWKLALMFGAFRRGEHGAWNEVLTARCSEFEVRTRRPMPINTDGDLLTETPARFVVHPDAIAVFAP